MVNLADDVMSLRDRFALAAMQGDWASRDSLAKTMGYDNAAHYYYKMADAMMRVRREFVGKPVVWGEAARGGVASSP